MYKILILAVVQGIAEFLPVSSSGHLVILGALLSELGQAASKLGGSPTLEITLHAGTLGSILVVYWKKIIQLLTSDRRVVPVLAVGTLPVVVVGLTIKTGFPTLLLNPLLAAVMLLVTGGMLVALGRLRAREGCYQDLTWHAALLIGCFQSVAILPGISRSGSTILGGRLLGLKKEDSVTFSFLLAIPAILGASVLEAKEIWDQISAGNKLEFSFTELGFGAGLSFLVGVFALKWLIGWSSKDRLHWFAWWCFPVGILAIYHFYGAP